MNNIMTLIKIMFTRHYKVESDIGTIGIWYKNVYGKLTRVYSVSGSSVLHNGGGYSFKKIAIKMLFG